MTNKTGTVQYQYPRIFLKRNKEESLLRRHPWVFSGALSHAEGEAEEGTVADVYTASGEFIARDHCQVGSIAVRVLTFRQEEIDIPWWEGRLAGALAVRRALSLAGSADTDCYRLVHGEGDLLPGLIIDLYGEVAVVQCHSVGMYLAREEICTALRAVMGVDLKAVYDKSSRTVAYNAGLDAVDGYLWKAEGYTLPDESTVTENGLKFAVNWERGQKTGFFLDQRDSRALVRRYARGRRVLNTFCYTGGFSVYALAGGAASVDSVDSSEHAIEMTDRNILLNFGPEAAHRSFTADATRFVRDMEPGYHMVILDPPAFAKHLKAVPNALQGYKRLNSRAIAAIAPGGILFTFSCSQAVSAEQFRTTVFTSAAIAGRNVRILHQLTQPADHPVSIYHPEGEYLKGLVLYVE